MTNAQNSGAVELLACPNPWCEADERNGDFRPQVQYSNFGMVYVACTSCTMAGPTRQHEVDAITAWNTRSTPAPSDQVGWQDIALAPFNELVWCFEPHDMGGFMFAGGKNNGGNWYNNLDDKRQYPTHWMPLPTAPTLTAGEGGGDE